MSYSNTYHYGTQGQTVVSYNYQQPQQYNQNYQYDQQYQYQSHQQYQPSTYQPQPPSPYQQPAYQAPPPYQPQPPTTYQHSGTYESYNSAPQWNNNQHQYDGRSYHGAPQQQQQYVPAHAPMAPPTAVQSVGTSHQRYQYSDLHGKRKALLIGINYFGGSAPLQGCINDVHNIKDFLIRGYRFSADNMWVMTDDLQDPRSLPTRANILIGMQWLVANAQPGDDLFLHYSGHGGPVKDVDGDEEDGTDEAIFPMDSDTITDGPGFIVDDIIHDICVKPLPQGCRLTAIFDCCHSGSIMDLPYTYSTKGVLKQPSFLKDTSMGLLGIGAAYAQEDMGSMLVGAFGLVKKVTNHATGKYRKVREAKTSAADVICFSGCKDTQTSTDAHISSQRQGAMSHAFKSALVKAQGNLTYIQLLNAIREELIAGNFEQKPQLSACHPIDLDLLFTL